MRGIVCLALSHPISIHQFSSAIESVLPYRVLTQPRPRVSTGGSPGLVAGPSDTRLGVHEGESVATPSGIPAGLEIWQQMHYTEWCNYAMLYNSRYLAMVSLAI